jgi:riboflavin synthase
MVFAGVIRYTGDAQVVGRKLQISRVDAGLLEDLRVRDTIAINGVALPITAVVEGGLEFELSDEVLATTTFAVAPPQVHVEPALSMGEEAHGYTITGIVHGVGVITSVQRSPPLDGLGSPMDVNLPLTRFPVYPKKNDYVIVDGVILTVVEVDSSAESIRFLLTPHTLAATLFAAYVEGPVPVNIEFSRRTKPSKGGGKKR